MSLEEHEISIVDENKIFKTKGISQIVLSECKEQLQASSSSKYVCFCHKYGHLFVGINDYLIIVSLNDAIEVAEAIKLNKNEKVENLKKRVLRFPLYIHAIFLNESNSELGIYAIKNTSNETMHTFSIYNIEALVSSSIKNVNDALIDSVAMFSSDIFNKTDTITTLLCLESLEDSAYFRLAAIFKDLAPFEIFYDESSKKYAVKKLLTNTDVSSLCVDPFNNQVYIGTNQGQLKVAKSLNELNNIIHTQTIPPIISNQPLEVSSIQCVNNGSIIVNYMGPETSEYGCRFPYSVIYTDDFKKANICQNLFYYDSEAAEKGYPFFRATVLDPQLSVLIAYMSLSPDAEIIFKNSGDSDEYSQVLLDEDDKFTCPVAADFTQTNVIGVCSIPIDFVPFTGGEQKQLSDLVILLSSDGILMLSCIDWLVPINTSLKKITHLSQCQPIESNMDLPLYKSKGDEISTSDETITASPPDPFNTGTLSSALSTNEAPADLFNTKTLSSALSKNEAPADPFNTKTLSSTLSMNKASSDPFNTNTLSSALSMNEAPPDTLSSPLSLNVFKVENLTLPNIEDVHPTDFTPTESQLKLIKLDPLNTPDYVIFDSNKNYVNLANVLEILKPEATFQSLIAEFNQLRLDQANDITKSIDGLLADLTNRLNLALDTCKLEDEATTKDLQTYLEYKACAEFVAKLSVTCKAQLSLINMDEFSNYNTFHSHNTQLLDKIVEIERKVQSFLPRIKTTYEKLRPKSRNIACAMNKLESHTIHHLNNQLEKYADQREILANKITQLALKTNQFVDLNIDNVYKNHIKSKVEKHMSKLTFPINKKIESSGHKKNFFKSIESHYKTNPTTSCLIDANLENDHVINQQIKTHLNINDNTINKDENYCASTPRTSRTIRTIPILLDIQDKNQIIYDMDPTCYNIDAKYSRLSSFNPGNCFDNYDLNSNQTDFFDNNLFLANKPLTFNITNKSMIDNEWSNFIAALKKLDDSPILYEEFLQCLNDLSAGDFLIDPDVNDISAGDSSSGFDLSDDDDDDIYDLSYGESSDVTDQKINVLSAHNSSADINPAALEIYNQSIFNVYNASVMQFLPTLVENDNFKHPETIQHIHNKISYTKQKREYCDQNMISYNPESVPFSNEEAHLISVFKLLGLSYENYLERNNNSPKLTKSNSENELSVEQVINALQEVSAVLDAKPIVSDNKLTEGVNIELSNILTNNDVFNNVTNSLINNGCSIVTNNDVTNEVIIHNGNISDSSDCLDLTKIDKEDELPLFLPLGLREEVISQCLDSGSSVDDINKTFGYDRWAAYNPKYKNDAVTSSCFASLYNEIKNGKTKSDNLTSTAMDSSIKNSLDKSNLLLSAADAKQQSSNLCGTNKDMPSNNLFGVNKDVSSNLFGANKEHLSGSLLGANKEDSSNIFGRNKDSSTHLFGGNKESSSNIFSANKDTATNIFGTTNEPQSSNLFREINEFHPSSLFGNTKESQSSNLFGANKDSSTNIFGAKKEPLSGSLFGTNTDSTSNLFGANKESPSNNIFGANKESQSNNLFGANKEPLSGSLFGTNTNSISNLFGANNESQSNTLFGANKESQSNNLFGANKESQSNNLFGANKEPLSGSLFGTNTNSTSNLFGTKKEPLSGSLFGTSTDSVSNLFGANKELSNNLFNQNLFNSKPTSLLNQPSNVTQTNLNSNEINQLGGLFGKLPTPYDKANQKDDDDEWLGELSHTQPTPIHPPGQSSFQSNTSAGGGSMISTPYNQNSGSLLNFDAYNTNMKFNVNIASNQGDAFKFGSDAIVFSGNTQNSQSGGANIMKSMLSTTNTQQTGNNQATSGANVFSNAMKNFDFNAKFMQ